MGCVLYSGATNIPVENAEQCILLRYGVIPKRWRHNRAKALSRPCIVMSASAATIITVTSINITAG